MDKKRVLSGIQATGKLTLGNYLGALNTWVKMQEEYDCYYMIADLHTLTVRRDAEELRENTLNLIAMYLAAGLDPEKNTIFIQSHVPAHSELSWILGCYTYIGELNRMTQYKDKSAKHADNINSGLFTYPVLMAADILLYNADYVPVGEDQKQHLELTRDIAERFNSIYGDTFVIPEPYTKKEGARIMGLQNPEAKMSKSSTNPNDVIFLEDEPEVIMSKFKKAVTDSDGVVKYNSETKPGISNLMEIYSVITGKNMEEIEREFEGQGYGTFKEAVGNIVVQKELKQNPEYLESIYRKGAQQAALIANETIKEVKNKVGLVK